MAESDIIDVKPAPTEEIHSWLLTSWPFELDISRYASSELETLERLYGSWDNARYALGFQEQDLTSWRTNQSPILEIGPGGGTSSQQLLDKGINLFILEPSLKYSYDHDILNAAKSRFSGRRFEGRVSDANAADATLAFPGQQFRVAFAIGPNFQNYAPSELALVNQIGGSYML